MSKPERFVSACIGALLFAACVVFIVSAAMALHYHSKAIDSLDRIEQRCGR